MRTLDVADVAPPQLGSVQAPPAPLLDLALEPLDLAPKVSDDVRVLGDVVGDAEQVLLHLGRGGVQSPGGRGLPLGTLSFSWMTDSNDFPASDPVLCCGSWLSRV